jgi:CBS domain containing-hemolysin-like protein
MAVLLDYILGPDSDEVMNREELNALIQITQMNQTSSTTDGDDSNRETLTSHEVNAISGVFSMEKKLAKDIMIPMNKVDMI